MGNYLIFNAIMWVACIAMNKGTGHTGKYVGRYSTCLHMRPVAGPRRQQTSAVEANPHWILMVVIS